MFNERKQIQIKNIQIRDPDPASPLHGGDRQLTLVFIRYWIRIQLSDSGIK